MPLRFLEIRKKYPTQQTHSHAEEQKNKQLRWGVSSNN